MKRKRTGIIVLLALAISVCFTEGTASSAEKYQRVDPNELTFRLETKEVFFTDGGKKIIGSVKALYCEDQLIELLSNEIDNGFITTKKYGKIMISPPPSLTTPYLPISLTPSQKKEFLKLKKK